MSKTHRNNYTQIIELIEDKSRIGVCIDTCHIFAAGYDIRTGKDFEKSFKDFQKIVGFKYLCGLHVNDSKAEFASRVDRHEQIGKGKIGITPFKLLMADKRFNKIPMVLETRDPEVWPEEIKMLKKFEK